MTSRNTGTVLSWSYQGDRRSSCMEDDISTAEVSMGFGSKKIMASDIYRNYCSVLMG